MIIHKQSLIGHTLEECTYQRSQEIPPYIFLDSTAVDAYGRQETFGIDETSIFKNILLLGGAGSGKTNVMNQIIAQARGWTGTAGSAVHLIFDTKADFIKHRGFYRDGDIIIANDRHYRKKSAVWNVFLEIMADGDEDIESNAREIAAVYFKNRGSKTQPFFANAARDIFAATMIYFIRRYRDNYDKWKNKLNNAYLRTFLMTYSAEQIMKYLSIYPEFRGLASYIGNGDNNQALGVIAELRSMLNECFQGKFAEEAKPGEKYFSIRETVRNKKDQAVFIIYDLSVGESLSPVYSLLFDLALKEALSVSDENVNGRVHLFLDELKLLPSITKMEDAVNFGRSKRVSVVAGIQSISQIYSAYDDKIGRNILAGFGSKIVFRLNDSESREYISHLYGSNLTAYNYQISGNAQAPREREGYTVEDTDLIDLKLPGQAIVGLASQTTPFRFRFSRDQFM